MTKQEVWNQQKYQTWITSLQSERDLDYLKFQQSLIPEKENIIGIRMPRIRKIAKEISKTDLPSFLAHNQHFYYEETMIHGLLLENEKDFHVLLKRLEEFLPYNDNWAVNDSISNHLKQFKKHQEEGFRWISKQLYSQKPWNIRFGYTLLLSHFVNETYIDAILNECNQKQYDTYYVKMAVAWLLSICYIKFPVQTERFFQNNHLDAWTHNKAIQKICESFRVSLEAKKHLRTLKR